MYQKQYSMRQIHKVFLTALTALFVIMPTSAKTKHTPHGTWQLVWQDNFKGKKLSDVWTRIPRFPMPPEWNKYMSTDERLLRMRRGKLTLLGVVNDILPNDTARFLTAGVYTRGKKTFHRGRIEIRLRMDNADGAWPAAWLLPEDPWPYGGEIDIMERLNHENEGLQTVHSAFTVYDKKTKNKPRSGFSGPIRNNHYNTYGVELYEDSLCFFINDTYYGTYRRQPEYGTDQYPFDRPMYLLIDMQLGAHWLPPVKAEELPFRYRIDYVRYYKKKE